MDRPAVSLTIAASVAIVRFDRPDQLNAIDIRLHHDLAHAFDQIEADETIGAVILTGAGRAFSAGQDLGERAATFAAGDTPDLARSLDELYNPLVRHIAALPVPVIAAVNGIAFGAGAAIAIGCDIILAAETARFQFGFVKVGLGPDCGTSWLLPRLVGQARALDLTLSGRGVDAREAERIGLVSQVVPDADLANTAGKLAAALASSPRNALAAIKRQLRGASCQSFDQALDTERDTQGRLGSEADYRKAMMRFTSQRAGKARPNHRTRTPRQ